MTEIKDLILENEDFCIIYGDLRVTGEVRIRDSNVIVSGKLIFADSKGRDIEIEGSDICAESIIIDDPSDDEYSPGDMHITDGDIWTSKDLSSEGIIKSDGNIEVKGDSRVSDIICKDYIVHGDNDSEDIEACNIYIGGDNDSYSLTAESDIYLNSDAELHKTYIKAGSSFYIEGKLTNCIGISVN